MNGQQTIELKGGKAYATSYCLVVLIGMQNDKRIKTTMGVYNNDEFVRQTLPGRSSSLSGNNVYGSKECIAC